VSTLKTVQAASNSTSCELEFPALLANLDSNALLYWSTYTINKHRWLFRYQGTIHFPFLPSLPPAVNGVPVAWDDGQNTNLPHV